MRGALRDTALEGRSERGQRRGTGPCKGRDDALMVNQGSVFLLDWEKTLFYLSRYRNVTL